MDDIKDNKTESKTTEIGGTAVTKDKTSADSGLKMLFQPIYCPLEERIFGYESLLRIVDTELGVLTPGMFLSVAEKNYNLIAGLEEWSINEILDCAEQLATKGKKLEMLSVNISSKHFLDIGFLDKVVKIASYHNVPLSNIWFEIKEEILFSKEEYVRNTIRKIRKMGIRIAIDDFSVDFLAVLRRRKPWFDMVKIAKKYTDGVLNNPKSQAIVGSIIEYAKANALDIVAVGVENEEQEKAFLDLGVDKMQGYYYSKPLQMRRLFRKK